MDGPFHGRGSLRTARSIALRRPTWPEVRVLVSAEATRAVGALPYDFPMAVGIFIIVPPGTPGSQKQQQKILGIRYMYLYQFSLTTTKYQKEKHLFIWIFSQQLSPLILGHVHTPCNGAVRFSVSKWKRNSSLSGNPWVSSIAYLILPTGANSGAEIHEHGLEGSMAGKK